VAQTETTEAPRYRVTSAYVTVKSASGNPLNGGVGVVGRLRHSLLPEDALAEDVARLVARGMVEAVDDA
jgi:hypothetical protein